MKIGISGGTGLIGRALGEALRKRGDTVVVFSRQSNPPKMYQTEGYEFVSRQIPLPEDIVALDGLVNLAGENLAGVRWTGSAKDRFRKSRVDHTKRIVASIQEAFIDSKPRLQTFVSASAVGYYGSYEETGTSFTEDSPPGDNFLAELSRDWEDAARPVEELGVRLAMPRIGVVLDPEGGALAKLIPVFKSFIGGAIGQGNQGMSWIHRDDMVAGILFLLDNPKARGACNFTSPNPVTNRRFSEVLGKVLGRPSGFPTPAFGIQILFGEGATVVTQGQMVLPKKMEELGYSFLHPDLEEALTNLLKK